MCPVRLSQVIGVVSVGLLLAGPVAATGKQDQKTNTAGSDETAPPAGASQEPAKEEEGGLTDEFAMLEEEAVVESAARHRQDIGMSPSAVTVITREDIEASGATSLTDLLRLVPGMDVILTSRLCPSASDRLYWTNENNLLLVLVDGWEANNELLGQPPWEILPIQLDDVERIEVIRGPASPLYGANAVAGVVSITTRPVAEKTSASASFGAGEWGTLQASARGELRLGDWGISLSSGADLGGAFSDREAMDEQVYKARAVVERRFSESRRLVFEGGISYGDGYTSSLMGRVQSNMDLGNLRVAYQSPDLQGQLYWYLLPTEGGLQGPLDYKGIRLATFSPATVDVHTFGAEVQWTVPRFWDPLRIIVGAGGRASWVRSAGLLDESYADPQSSNYHETGVSYWEGRGGIFLHTELAPLDWFTVTAGARFDYNSVTQGFLSPQLALIFKPASGQFLRLSVSRAFRKPAYMESGLHVMADVPENSLFSKSEFLEFMTRVIGNSHLDNEKFLAVEAGYLGRFLDGQLTASLDLYFNQNADIISIEQNLVSDPIRPINLKKSSVQFANVGGTLDIVGGELGLRWAITKNIVVQGSWAYREVYDHDTGRARDDSPKNMFTLGGRFRTDWGLVGSLFAFIRSEFRDSAVDNPAGLFEPPLSVHMDTALLLLGRLGYRWICAEGVELESGVKLFLPIPRYCEKGCVTTAGGGNYGGDILARLLLVYLQASF